MRKTLRFLPAFNGRDGAIERWLQLDIVQALTAMKAKPNRGRMPSQVRASLAEAHRRKQRTRNDA